MSEYLIFTLTASLAAMGDLAGHERRGSLGWPGRSALLGLLGAAMGVTRDGDFAALDVLHLAVAVFDPGQPLRDYHTVETVPTAAARRPQSRPEAMALAKGKTNTTITLRDYRMAPLYGVAVWGGDLAALKAALERPSFTLYLGRKSCPLAAPVGASIVEAARPETALTLLRLPPWRKAASAATLVLDASDKASPRRTEQRHDQPLDRVKWHFSPRQMAFQDVRIAPGNRV